MHLPFQTARGVLGILIGLFVAAAIALFAGFAAPAAFADSDGPATKSKCPSGWLFSKRCGACAKKCRKGEVWSCDAQICVKKSSYRPLNDQELYDEATSLIQAGYYVDALELLWSIEKRQDPKVLNYIGYATRKLGNVDRGIEFYHKALAINANYHRAREYLGEGYLQKGDLDSAKAQLNEIAARCGTACEEYQKLANAIVHHVTGVKLGKDW